MEKEITERDKSDLKRMIADVSYDILQRHLKKRMVNLVWNKIGNVAFEESNKVSCSTYFNEDESEIIIRFKLAP